MRISDWSSDVCSSDLRHDRRTPEMLMVDLVAAQHEDRDVDDGEDAEEEERGRAPQRRHRADEGDEAEGEQRGEDDGGPGRASAAMHPAEDRWQAALAAHVVAEAPRERKSVGEGKRVAGRLESGG